MHSGNEKVPLDVQVTFFEFVGSDEVEETKGGTFASNGESIIRRRRHRLHDRLEISQEGRPILEP